MVRKFAGFALGRLGAAWLHAGVAAAMWATSVCVVQAAAEPAIGRANRGLEERIERRLCDPYGALPEPEVQPPPTHEDAFEPWELVGV